MFNIFLNDFLFFIPKASIHNFADDNTLYSILYILHKGRSDYTNIEVEIGNEKISWTSSVKLLGVHINDKLNFNEHINKICKSAGNQLNALIPLKSFLGLK